jgi:acyl-CoA thioesterase
MTPKERAEQSAAAMWAGDQATRWYGMNLIDVDEGRAVLSLTVEPHHANGLGICHGGVTFSLADSAFAFACNSRNQSTVAQQNQITYLAPARVGETLIATAVETSLSGRSGVTDVSVETEDGRKVAVFRGLSRAIKGMLSDEGISK